MQEVTGGSEADNEGVRKGWKISKIDESPFSTRLSRSVANSGGAFNVQFRTKNEVTYFLENNIKIWFLFVLFWDVPVSIKF
mgnify:CR=1 FL=1